MIAAQPTAADYGVVFETERHHEYAVIDFFESERGFALERDRLEAAAYVLACPVKANPPNWQHGRVIYAATRRYFADHFRHTTMHKSGALPDGPFTLLDIGTAKGFSALCLQWALQDAGALGAVVSVDVIDPLARVRRNTVADCDGEKTLAEVLAAWPEARKVAFQKSTGVDWLERHPARVHVAFVDGKHVGSVVRREGELLAQRQQPGDVAIFDDMQIDGVAAAVDSLKPWYMLTEVHPLPTRAYAFGVRR